MRHFLLRILIFTFVLSCSKEDEPEKRLPLTCDVFGSTSVQISNINEDGATATIDLSGYQLSPATVEIGFIYKLETNQQEFYVYLDPELIDGTLTKTIEENLIAGYVYEIKGFMTLNGTECYSKSTTFESKGSQTIYTTPLTCQFFVGSTPGLRDITSAGVTAFLEITPYVSYENVENYGFMIRTGASDDVQTITLPGKPTPTNFMTQINENLVCGLPYDIRAYVTINAATCYSQPITFTPAASSEESPWCANIYNLDTGFDNSFGITIDRKPYIIFQSNSFFEIDTVESTLIRRSNFPLAGNTGTYYSMFSIGKSGYFKSTGTGDIYKYDSDAGTWTNLGNAGLPTDRYFFGGQVGGNGFIFNYSASYKYDPDTNTFNKLADYAEDIFLQTFQTRTALYAITSSYDIMVFEPVSGVWSKIATYPGNKSEWVVALVNKTKVYIGLSHRYFSPDRISYFDSYELDLLTNQWRELQTFPFEYVNSYNIASASAHNSAYTVYRNGYGEGTTVWRFEPLNVVYK